MVSEKQEQRECTSEVTSNLNCAAWKLQGLAGLMFIQDAGKSILLDDNQANGLCYLLESIAEEIKANAELITEAKTS